MLQNSAFSCNFITAANTAYLQCLNQLFRQNLNNQTLSLFAILRKIMVTKQANHKLQIPRDLDSKEFAHNKYEYYKLLREESPVFHGKFIVANSYVLSRYEDCVMMLNDPRFIRDRSTITGGSKSIIPLPLPSFISLPKSLELMAQNMLYEDEPDHKRLRDRKSVV